MLSKLKRIFGSIVFLVLVVALLTQTSYALRVPMTTSEKHTQIFINGFYQEEKDSLSVVMLGSSAIYRYYVAPLAWQNYGFTSYCYASTCQSNDISEFLMQDIQSTQSPDLYVIELRQLVRSETFNLYEEDELKPDRAAAYNAFLTNSMKYSTARTKVVNEVFKEDKLSYNLDLIRNHILWKYTDVKTALKRPEKVYAEEYKMKSARTAAAHQAFVCNDLTDYAERAPLTDDAYRQMDEVFEYIRENDLKVLFISTPYVEDEHTMAIENSIEDYMKENGMDYLNCNKHYDQLGLDYSTDFYNAKHVNVLGATKVTDFLGKYITENYDINTEYTDSVKKSWDKGYELWDEHRNKQVEKVNKKLA